MGEGNNNGQRPGQQTGRLRILILAVVFIVVVIVLASCLVRGCARKVGEVFENGGGDSLWSFDTADYTANYYTPTATTNAGQIDTTVAEGAREKRTQILGGGQDVATVMVYICGADLESNGGAATMDIMEMLKAGIGENVNLILYTGGTTKWQNRQMSSSVNQIYQVSGDKLYLLNKNAGSKSMTDPDTLAEFIKYCGKNFPANRNMLILWDHGGGSVTGYGSDENFSYTGPMDLKGISKALKKGGVSFDFVGFDACLMATLENGLMLDDYADYLIASEETEVGYGWCYTDWLSALSQDASIPTVELGKEIADSFLADARAHGQNYAGTLSVVDLAELKSTVPAKLEAFAKEITDSVEGSGSGDYKSISRARAAAREFGSSYYIDQVDLADFADRLNTNASNELAKALRSAVKYNNITSDMSGSYGISVYFPHANASYVNKAGDVYEAIGMPKAYTRCVESYAALEVSGQYISGGSGDPFNSLFGLFGSGSYGDSSYYGNSTGSSYSASTITDLLGEFMGGSMGGFSDYDSSDFSFFRSSLNTEAASNYLAENQFDETKLEWKQNEKGAPVITLPKEQWELVQDIALNMFYDDGEGLIDLGTDNVFSFDEAGNLVGENDHTWLTIDGHYMAYYYESTFKDGDAYVIKGYSPIRLNGKDARLLLQFDTEHPYGYIAGVQYTEAAEQENENIGKTLGAGLKEVADLEGSAEAKEAPALQEGDTIEFTADFYDYQGNFQDAFVLGEPWTVGNEEPEIANMDLGADGALAMYVITDIYNKQYWTGVIPETEAK